MSFPSGWRDPSLASRVARAEVFTGLSSEPDSFPRPKASLTTTALSAAVMATGGPSDPIGQTQEALTKMYKAQNEMAHKISIVRDVPYVTRKNKTDPRKQMLDIYLPHDSDPFFRRSNLPLVIHFHGGGWVHGDRRSEMFGAPALARSLAAKGCVVVTPSYRLGTLDFMADAQKAVLYAVQNAVTLGADPSRLYLSGHSAGGNIAALLTTGPWLQAPVLPAGAVKGLIGMSGVYSLMKPLGGPLASYKNHIFDRYMRKKVFGEDLKTLVRHSPTALVRLGAGKETPFRSRWSDALGKLLVGNSAEASMAGGALDGVSWADELPPVLLLSASWDLGLESDAAYFAKALKRRTGIKPAHHIIPHTNHATMSWDEESFHIIRDFIREEDGLRQEVPLR